MKRTDNFKFTSTIHLKPYSSFSPTSGIPEKVCDQAAETRVTSGPLAMDVPTVSANDTRIAHLRTAIEQVRSHTAGLEAKLLPFETWRRMGVNAIHALTNDEDSIRSDLVVADEPEDLSDSTDEDGVTTQKRHQPKGERSPASQQRPLPPRRACVTAEVATSTEASATATAEASISASVAAATNASAGANASAVPADVIPSAAAADACCSSTGLIPSTITPNVNPGSRFFSQPSNDSHVAVAPAAGAVVDSGILREGDGSRSSEDSN
jgi:hypothetical protein